MVIGQQKLMHQSWRIQVFQVEKDRIALRWDSNSLHTIEFDETGPNAIKIAMQNDDYRLSIEGCAPHACSDGVSGFLVYFGSAGRAWAAKLTTAEDEHGDITRYNVVWTPDHDVTEQGKIARQLLESEMCRSTAISDPARLPFRCAQNAP